MKLDRTNSHWMPFTRCTLQQLPGTKRRLRQIGTPYRVVYRGPRPRASHWGTAARPTFTKKKDATYAQIYIRTANPS